MLNSGSSKWATELGSVQQDGGMFSQPVTAPDKNICQVYPPLYIYDTALIPDKET